MAKITVRPASPEDQKEISSLVNFEYFVHRHLDWRPPIEWIGKRPYWLIEDDSRLVGALAAAPDPPEVAWVRLFVANSAFGYEKAWKRLFDKVKHELKQIDQPYLAALALHKWFSNLISANGFEHFQDIVVLAWTSLNPPTRPRTAPGLTIRPMTTADIPCVAEVDNTSFERIWQISSGTLTRSFNQSAYATVVEVNGEVIGYQICTTNAYSAHLARLAVRQDQQHKHIGYALVQDLIDHFNTNHIHQITVNTQNNNQASLSLYQKIGFQLTGESFPVFLYKVK
jgi:ribosomal protein S18 acetylase RimI-like enzyme